MPTRVLQHGFAPTVDNYGLETGTWEDMPLHAQFLLDLEFLMRYAPRTSASCLYARSPPYLKEIASQFPWIHFYVYQHKDQHPLEYDPDRPEMLGDSPPTIQVHGNTTTAAMELTNNIARRLGENHEHCSRVMICHGLDPIRQLFLHVLMRPDFSLLDIQGLIPIDYPEGEIVLPILIPNNKIFTCIVVAREAKCRVYAPALFQDEIGAPLLPEHDVCPYTVFNTSSCLSTPLLLQPAGRWLASDPSRVTAFFQGVTRASESYDKACRDLITSEFARSTHKLHGCPEEILRLGLECTADLIQASRA